MSFFYQNRKEQLYLYLSNNNPYAVHLHRQLELIYVLSGSTTVTVEQQEFPLTPGQGVLVFPNQMQNMWNPVRIYSVSSSRISVIPSDIFSRIKSPHAMILPSPPSRSTATLPYRDLRLWLPPWKKIVPLLPMCRSMRKGI